MTSRKLRGSEKSLSPQQQEAKINEVRTSIGPIADKLPFLCSDASISRCLRARNWNVRKAAKMLKETLKWRLQFKPEKIQWEDVAHEAETGKVYRANYCDKSGRVVLVMRPGLQNTSSTGAQIKYLVYCMENAIMNLNPDQEQMVWLIDFEGWKMGCISVKMTREAAHVLQDHYPERLGLAVFYNPPKIFESFWTMVKPFLEPKTYRKVKFFYSNDPQSLKFMEELFDMDKLESTFGGRNKDGFNYEAYEQQMRKDDNKKSDFLSFGCSSPSNASSLLSSDSFQSTDHNSAEALDEHGLCEHNLSSDDEDEAACSNLETSDEMRTEGSSPVGQNTATICEAMRQLQAQPQ